MDYPPGLTLYPVRRDFIEGLVFRWRSAVRYSKLDPDLYKEFFSQLFLSDTESNVWAVGHSTGCWYIRRNDHWVPGEPPRILFILTTKEILSQITSEEAGPAEQVQQQVSQAQEGQETPAFEQACPKCGESIPTGRRYCTHCGANLAVEKPPKPAPAAFTCRTCGATHPTGKKFCTNCGVRLDG